MTVLSAQTIRRTGLIKPCVPSYKDRSGNSCGLSVCGYDLSLDVDVRLMAGCHRLASAEQEFSIPNNVVGVVHDKSSLARQGLAVQNTVLEPGWRGFVTLELTNHGVKHFQFLRGDAIAQVVFHFLDEPTEMPYSGKYQDQGRGPQEAR